jgi:beta-glucanase (GH16 family)
MICFEVKDHEPSLLPDGEWSLVWNDEFDGDKLDRSKWDFRRHLFHKEHKAWIGEEGIEFDGNSNIIFKMVEKDGKYYSSQLQTGENWYDRPGTKSTWDIAPFRAPKFLHKYGYYEIRCHLQQGDKWWSAFWLQSPNIGTHPDPKIAGVEVDIMESFGPGPDPGQLTCGNFYGGYGRDLKADARKHYRIDNVDEFHRFGLLWTENEYVIYCDGIEVSRTDKVVSKVEQFILLSTEIQGYRRGNGKMHEPKAELSIDDEFVVDYVRVFDEIK